MNKIIVTAVILAFLSTDAYADEGEKGEHKAYREGQKERIKAYRTEQKKKNKAFRESLEERLITYGAEGCVRGDSLPSRLEGDQADTYGCRL